MNTEDTTTYQNAIQLARTEQIRRAYDQFCILSKNHANRHHPDLLLWIAETTPSYHEAQRAINEVTSIAPYHPGLPQAQAQLAHRQQPIPHVNMHLIQQEGEECNTMQQEPFYDPNQPASQYQQPQPPQEQQFVIDRQLPSANQYQQWQIQGQFTKSYTTPAIITLVLYIFLWIPGLIANIVYLLEAQKTKRVTGTNPDGYGCLVALLCMVAGAPVAIFALWIVFVIFAALFGAAAH